MRVTSKNIVYNSYTPATTRGWGGEKGGYDTASGLDRTDPPPIEGMVREETRGLGLGAGAAREIYTAIEQSSRESQRLVRMDNKRLHATRIEERLREVERRRDERIRAVAVRQQSVSNRKAELAAAERLRKDQRARGIKTPKRVWHEELGIPYVVLARHRYPHPDKPLPLRKRELDVPHPYSRSMRRMQDELLTWQSYWWCPRLGGGLNTPRSIGSISLRGNPDWTSENLLDANVEVALVNKLREKLNGSDFHVGTFLGEGHQSLRLIGDTAIKLAKVYHFTRRGDFWAASRAMFENTTRAPLSSRMSQQWPTVQDLNRAARDGRGVPWGPGNLWGYASKDANILSARILEIQYGWRPLVQDIYGAAQSVAWLLHAPYLFKERVRAKETRYVPPYWGGSGPKGSVFWYTDYQDFGDTGGGCQSVVRYKDALPANKTHKKQLLAYFRELPHGLARLGLADPSTVLWELTPFSFVADWVLPIGDYLTARAFAGQLSGTFVTSELKTGKTGSWSDLVFSRQVSYSLDVPPPKVKSLEKVASFQHCLNGLALLTQVATGYSAKVK